MGGRGIKTWEKVKHSLPEIPDSSQILFTTQPGHAREIAAAAADYNTIVAVGGDGTVGEVITGIMESTEPHSRLGIIPTGTGNDIARNLAIYSIDDSVTSLSGKNSRRVDLIKIECRKDDLLVIRYAFIQCNVGFSAVARAKPWMKRWFGPAVSYRLAIIIELLLYRPPDMKISWDSGEIDGENFVASICNVETTVGGSMRLAPDAEFDDGVLNTFVIPNSSLVKLLSLLPKISTGAHVDEPDVTYFPSREIKIEANPAARIDVDGDPFGITPAAVSVCPGALDVLIP